MKGSGMVVLAVLCILPFAAPFSTPLPAAGVSAIGTLVGRAGCPHPLLLAPRRNVHDHPARALLCEGSRGRGAVSRLSVFAENEFGDYPEEEEDEDEFEPWQNPSPLLRACLAGDAGAVKVLFSGDALSILDEADRTCLHYACYGGDAETIELLLASAHGEALALMTDKFGGTAIHTAAERGHARAAIKVADKAGARTLMLQDCNLYTCLHYASEIPKDDVELVKYLVEIGGDDLVKATDLAGQTCLHCAAYHGNLEVSQYLAQYGETAMDNAREAVQWNAKALKVYQYLKKQSA